jgi:hypothetical protein
MHNKEDKQPAKRRKPRQQRVEDQLWQGREQLANQLLQAYDDLLVDASQITVIDKRNIVSLTYKPEWKSYEKMINNLIFRNYRQILVDEDVKSAKKLIYFATSLKNLPKSFKTSSSAEENEIQDNPEDKGIEL